MAGVVTVIPYLAKPFQTVPSAQEVITRTKKRKRAFFIKTDSLCKVNGVFYPEEQ